MKEMIKFSPEITNIFFELTKEITTESPFSNKQKELILIGIFTSNQGFNGLKHHIKKAIEQGASQEEVLYSILLALPVVGITVTNKAFKIAYSITKDFINE